MNIYYVNSIRKLRFSTTGECQRTDLWSIEERNSFMETHTNLTYQVETWKQGNFSTVLLYSCACSGLKILNRFIIFAIQYCKMHYLGKGCCWNFNSRSPFHWFQSSGNQCFHINSLDRTMMEKQLRHAALTSYLNKWAKICSSIKCPGCYKASIIPNTQMNAYINASLLSDNVPWCILLYYLTLSNSRPFLVIDQLCNNRTIYLIPMPIL